MNQDDPFASPDLDKTVIMPSPGGRVPPAARSTSLWQSAAFMATSSSGMTNAEDFSEITGLSPLVTAANPLLNSVPQLRMTLQHANPSGLRDSLVQHIKLFESRAKASGISPEKVIAARYALCTLLDETIASTPWGNSEWGKYSLLVTFHNEAAGGEKFFQLLTKLAETPKANRDLLELMYICLSSGFEGRYRLMTNGKAQLDILRERLAQILSRERGTFERDLSPHWQATLIKRPRLFALLPLWVLSALCGLILLVTYSGFSFLLNNASDPIFAQIQSIQAQHMIPGRISAPPASTTPVLRKFLAREIQQGLITIRDKEGHSLITLLGDGVFAPGSATVSERFTLILARIAEILGTSPGSVQILGHTDSQPIRSTRFPSNWHLSQERAHSVMQRLIHTGLPESRLSAEGRADAEPIAPNNTPAGRAQNRRVEIAVFPALQPDSPPVNTRAAHIHRMSRD